MKPVYSILFGVTEGRSILQGMSKETGGGYFEVTKKFDIDQVFGAIQDELRSQHNWGMCGMCRSGFPSSGDCRLTVKEKGFTVQAREKYWAQR